MRAFALLLAVVLAQSIVPVSQEQEPPYEDHSVCTTKCAPVKQDKPGLKGCACPASKGETCDAEGNRTTHALDGCVNGANCKKHCCFCCPKD